MATSTLLAASTFRSNDPYLKMLVDSGSTANFVDPSLSPGLQAFMSDVKVLRVPHTIIAAGHHLRNGIARGTANGIVISTTVVLNDTSLLEQLWYQD